MEKTKWSEYENYLVMAHETPNLKMNYGAFLDFKLVKKFLQRIATSTDNDTFLYEKTIYKKVISSVDATNILNKLFKNKFDYRIKVLGNQIGVRL
jgi:hypothetical protein